MRILLPIVLLTSAMASDVLQPCPANPRYLHWRDKPVLLIGSGEHYGAVCNLDFDFRRYLQQLQRDGLNITRVFTGAAYVEPQGAFDIEHNTLAPAPGRYLAPWARSETPGAWDGGMKWNLERWDEAYFQRFRDFVAEAGKSGVVVEVVLFCPFYADKDDKTKSPMWPLSAFHPSNNVQRTEGTPHDKVWTLDAHPRLLAAQERFVRRLVSDLSPADNVYYEVCNEPYFGGVTADWQRYIVDVITEAQQGQAQPKMISLNVANRTGQFPDPPAEVGLFNFHYTYPPVAVTDNWSLVKAIGNNETGFRGQADEVYRNEAWDWILAGGASFNHLDYSFTAGHEDGSFAYGEKQPGGGGATLRRQFRVLADFMKQLDFVRMAPAPDLIQGLGPEVSLRLLSGEGQLVGYLHHSKAGVWKKSKELRHGKFRDTFTLQAPAANYQIHWLIPSTGEVIKVDNRRDFQLTTPEYEVDLAFRVVKT